MMWAASLKAIYNQISPSRLLVADAEELTAGLFIPKAAGSHVGIKGLPLLP